ncbi:uncharacterized protein LOC127831851 [Dreissena polymorpha]|uniref:Uncharacterized protein n=1 Tax=Dreissena polymorpha TaxID=45954 RepID=A0A9D4JVG6_DREPO|nr:uncharacterized protein LOC127831851 [Dreissena polymorpha]KAH3821958.1 hypothetical protein DPMN_123726 [Dreissena polymorpha]
MNLLYFGIVLAGLISLGSALECYVCNDQPNNQDKCVKTTIQCKKNHDTCRTYIHWRQPPYWTPRSERIFSIDKSCTTRQECENEQRVLGLRCFRDWYRDWMCTECCQGDRCNYYVTLGASSVQLSIGLLASALLFIQMVLNVRR